jgi:hypothetical protein
MIILFLIGVLGLGRLVVNSLHLTWNRFEGWTLVVLFGYFFSAWMLLIACAVLGFQIGAALGMILLLATWILPQTRRQLFLRSFAASRQTAVWLITTGAFSLAIGYLLSRNMLDPDAGGTYGGRATNGDLPLHLSIINNVAYDTHFTWRFTLMAHTYLTYHFLIDFLSGMIVRWGGGLRFSLLLISIPFCLALVQLLFFLGYRAFSNVRAAALFTTLFLFCGSSYGFMPAILFFIHSLFHVSLLSDNFFLNFVNALSGNDFNNVICSLIPQRSLQCGLPVFCAIGILVFRLTKEISLHQRRRILFLIGLLTGLLPLAHIHSFFMALAVLITLTWFGRKMASPGEWLLSIATSVIIAAPQLAFQLFANHHASFVRYKPGWLFSSKSTQFPHDTGLVLYILATFGAILVMSLLSYRRLKNDDAVRGLILLGAALFIAAFLFIFQPLDYDNIKFFFYAYLFFSLGVAQYLALMSRAGNWLWLPLTIMLVGAGFRNIVDECPQHDLLYKDTAFSEAGKLRKQLPPDALVLTATTHDHPLWGLAGQPVVEGDTQYLADYGLPYQQISKDVETMYAGGDDSLALLQKYRVQYVLISHYERTDIPMTNESFFAQHFPLIYQQGGMEIYQIRRAS